MYSNCNFGKILLFLVVFGCKLLLADAKPSQPVMADTNSTTTTTTMHPTMPPQNNTEMEKPTHDDHACCEPKQPCKPKFVCLPRQCVCPPAPCGNKPPCPERDPPCHGSPCRNIFSHFYGYFDWMGHFYKWVERYGKWMANGVNRMFT